MDIYQSHALSTSCWLFLQAVPLFIYPQFMVNLLAPAPRAATDLETYFSRTLSLTLFTLALLPLLLSGLLPIEPPSSTSSSESHLHTPSSSPYAPAAAFITTTYHAAALIYCYLTYQSNGSVSLALGMVGSGVLASWGVLALVFGGGSAGGGGGAGKKVSGWPFRNREEREVKREKMMRKGKGL